MLLVPPAHHGGALVEESRDTCVTYDAAEELPRRLPLALQEGVQSAEQQHTGVVLLGLVARRDGSS
jgi:hypothetical protein